MYRSRVSIILKLSIIPWIVIYLPWLFFECTSSREVDWWWRTEMFFVIPLSIGTMLFTYSFILRIYGRLFHWHEPEYRAYIRAGGDPYFDCLPEGFNTRRPFYSTTVWSCRECGAEIEGQWAVCSNCGSNQQVASAGRHFNCGSCGQEVYEITYGDLDRGGVICPYCGTNNVPP
jgi:DNA-directed RNA polymerase subunit RPC12/RpoP